MKSMTLVLCKRVSLFLKHTWQYSGANKLLDVCMSLTPKWFSKKWRERDRRGLGDNENKQ